MNYIELVSNINDYLENEFSKEEVDKFIQQAEERIYNSVQLPDLRKNVTGNVTLGVQYLTCPADWLATFSLAIIDNSGTYTYLLNKDVSYIREAFPSPTDTALPRFYGQFDENTFILGPTPDSNYGVELHYFYYPESIVTAGTTWLGDNYETVLLYGALVEGYTYMKGDADLMTAYKTRYEEALAMLKQLADGKNRQDMYRTQQVRYPVR